MSFINNLERAELTLSAHAREGYSSHFVCLSVCHFSILEKAPISGLKLTSVYILGDDLSSLNVALFENRSYFGEKSSGTSAVTACSDVRGHCPVIKQFST